MRKIMIIGAGQLQIPAITKAKELGYRVAVVDQNPCAPGIQFADQFYNVSTNDVENIIVAAKEYNPDGMMTIATDLPMRAIAAAASQLGIPAITFETALNTTDKRRMIEHFKENKVPSPWYYVIRNESRLQDLAGKLKPPYIIKPTDNSGSRGVVLVTDALQVKDAFHYSMASARSGEILIEEYLEGPEVSVECFGCNNEIYVLQITDKLTTGTPHFVEIGHSQPSLLPLDTQRQIKEIAKLACKAVGIQVGPAHVEMIVTKEGPKLVEVGARLGGDCITSHLVPLSTGIDLVAATISQACGQRPDLSRKFVKGSAIRYIQAEQGRIFSMQGQDRALEISGVQEITFTKFPGDDSIEVCSSTDRIGYVIAQGKDALAAIKICEAALSCISLKIS